MESVKTGCVGMTPFPIAASTKASISYPCTMVRFGGGCPGAVAVSAVAASAGPVVIPSIPPLSPAKRAVKDFPPPISIPLSP